MSRRTLPLRMYRLLATEEMRFMLSRTTLRGLRMLRSGGNSVCVQGQSALALPSITPLQDHVVCTCSNRLVLPAASPAVQALYYSSPTHKPSSTQRIKVVLKEYGGVAVVFHTVMSLASLGTCYLIVSRLATSLIPIHSYPIQSYFYSMSTVVLMWGRCWNISMSSRQLPPREPQPLPWPMCCTRCCSLSEQG